MTISVDKLYFNKIKKYNAAFFVEVSFRKFQKLV